MRFAYRLEKAQLWVSESTLSGGALGRWISKALELLHAWSDVGNGLVMVLVGAIDGHMDG